MRNLLFAIALLTGSLASFAQSNMEDSSMENKVQGKFPELKSEGGSEKKWSAGIASGVNSPTGGLASSAEYGVIVGFQPTMNMSTALSANTTRLDTSNDVRQTNILFRSSYVFGGDVPVLKNSYVGVGAGPVIISNSKIRWAGAPIVGFDIPLSSKSHDYLSLGLEAKYMFITKTDVPDLFASALAVKYWF